MTSLDSDKDMIALAYSHRGSLTSDGDLMIYLFGELADLIDASKSIWKTCGQEATRQGLEQARAAEVSEGAVRASQGRGSITNPPTKSFPTKSP